MKLSRRLGVRLFVSYLLVVLVGGVAVLATTRLLAPTIFTEQLQQVRLRQGQTDDADPGSRGGGADTTGPSGPGGSGNTTGPGDGHDGGSGPGSSGGSGSGDGGQGSGDGGQGSGSREGSGAGGEQGGAPPGNGATDGSTTSSVANPAATVLFLQSDGGRTDAEIEEAFLASLNRALLVGLAASALLAVVVAAIVSNRIMRPIRDIGAAAARLAKGHYDERIEPPSTAELAELAGDFNELAATLEATEVRRMQLVSEVAHELRTPLTTIQGYMEGLIDGVLEPGDELYASVAEEAARLQKVAADLSLLSRIEEGAMPFEMTEIDASRVAAAVATRLAPQFDDQGVSLGVEAESALPVEGDADRLTQVFTNLLGNALAHTPAGGRVVISSQRRGQTARVTVADTGLGISTEDLEKVFDRFYRAGRSPQTTGTGIGLTIARSIVRSHGGDITAASAGPGKGATFTVELPLRE